MTASSSDFGRLSVHAVPPQAAAKKHCDAIPCECEVIHTSCRFGPLKSAIATSTLALPWQIYSRCCSLQIHFRQYGHRRGGSRAMSSRMAWRTVGRVGWGGGPLVLFSPCCCEAATLEEGVRDHRHQRMTHGGWRSAARFRTFQDYPRGWHRLWFVVLRGLDRAITRRPYTGSPHSKRGMIGSVITSTRPAFARVART
jgi:hypothetical protein